MTDTPTKAMVEAQVAAYELAFAPLHSEMKDELQHLQATDNWASDHLRSRILGIPSGWRLRIVPIMRYAVQNMRNTILNGNQPTVRARVASVRQTKAAEAKRKKLTLAGQGTLNRIWGNRAGMEALNDAAWQLSAHGIGCLVYDYYASCYPDEPDDGDDEAVANYNDVMAEAWPFSVRSVHPTNVMFDTEHDPPNVVVVKEQVRRDVAVARYPHLAEAWGMDAKAFVGTELVDRVQWWTADHCYESIAGAQTLDPKAGAQAEGVVENPYGFIPVAICTSGLGYSDNDYSLLTRYQGIVRSGRDVVLEALAEYNFYAIMRATRAVGGKDFTPNGDATAADARRAAQEYIDAPNARNVLPHGVTVAPSPLGDLPAFLGTLDEKTRQALEMWAGPAIQRGAFQTDNATVNVQNLSQALQLYKNAESSYCVAIGGMLKGFLRMYRALGQSSHAMRMMLDAETIEIKRDDIPASGYSFDVDGSPPTLAERAASLERDLALKDAGWIDDEEGALNQGIDNFDEIQKRKRMSAVRNGESVIMMLQDLYAQAIQDAYKKQQALLRQKDIESGVIPQPEQPQPGSDQDIQQQQEAAMQQQQQMQAMAPMPGGGMIQPPAGF